MTRNASSADGRIQQVASPQSSPPGSVSRAAPVGFLAWFQRLSCPRAQAGTGTTASCHASTADPPLPAEDRPRPSGSEQQQQPASRCESSAEKECHSSSPGKSMRSYSASRPRAPRKSKGALHTWGVDLPQPSGQQPSEHLLPQGSGDISRLLRGVPASAGEATDASSCPLPSTAGQRCSLGRDSDAEAPRDSPWQLGERHMFVPYGCMAASRNNSVSTSAGMNTVFYSSAASSAPDEMGFWNINVVGRRSATKLDHSSLELQEAKDNAPSELGSQEACRPGLNHGSSDQPITFFPAPSKVSAEERHAASRGPLTQKRKAVEIGSVQKKARPWMGSQAHSGSSTLLHPGSSQLSCLLDTLPSGRHHC